MERMRYISPLRYPGGKARLAPFFERVIRAQQHVPQQYAEPFAGGAGAALRLLVDRVSTTIHLNDLNVGIAAFWKAVFEEGEALARAVETADVTVDTWHAAHELYMDPKIVEGFELGFATFFLNRTNRSGILDARPIGGLEQTGNWKIDARFNRANLAERIRMLYSFRRSVKLYNLDALKFLEVIEPEGKDAFVYVDPPYIQQGDDLYMHAFDAEAHSALSLRLSMTTLPWVLTYDTHKRISDELYASHRCATFDISHTAQNQHVGSEYVLFSEALVVPDLQVTPNRTALLLAAQQS